AQAAPAPASFADLAEQRLDAVVNISTTQTVKGRRSIPMPNLPEGSPFRELFEEFFKRNQDKPQTRKVNSLGSGFIIDPAGIIVTNAHVIADADEIFVILNDDTKLKAKVLGRDKKVDIAVLKIEPEKPLTSVSFGDSSTLRVGDWVMAIGNPFGLGGTVTAGIVSARNRDINSGPYDSFIQTDAAINRGNSGGPLFDMDGKVIGVNTAIISPNGGSIGIGFAVPAAIVVPVIEQLRKFGETRRGWLGVRIQTVTDEIAEGLGLDEAAGALVAGVTPDGPAAAAGVKPGDVILEFDGRNVARMRDLPRIVADTPVGKSVDVMVFRKGAQVRVEVNIALLEESDQLAKDTATDKPKPSEALGLTFSKLTSDLRKKYELADGAQGVVVTDIDKQGLAADKGIEAGDVIVEIAQEEVSTPEQVVEKIKKLEKAGQKLVLLLVRKKDGDLRFIAVRLKT
ncbi:MAG: DegQ family serine endoprotease, partial [Alphaproteobacteria bacterium]